jgi:glyoxylase-like metal-dependent hydrolase (beta-lactamase superfamily II)
MTVPAGSSAIRIGGIEILPLLDGHTAGAEPDGVAGHDERVLAPHRNYLPGDGRYLIDFGAYLLRTDDRVILVDAGLGPPPTPTGVWDPSQAPAEAQQAVGELFRRLGRSEESIEARLRQMSDYTVTYGQLGQSLQQAGIAPASVTDVVLTHLHCDHVGWVARDGQPFFPRADIWCHQADIDYFLGPRAPDEAHFMGMYGVRPTKDRMAPVLGQLRPWESSGPVAPGIDLWHLPGHTPGSSVVWLASHGESGVIVGDVIHCPLELVDPHFTIAADLDPAAALAAKSRLIAAATRERSRILSTHFPGLRPGRLVDDGDDHQRTWSWD